MTDTGSTPTNATERLDQIVAGYSDLPTLAPVAVEVIRLADDENASMADLAAAISVDPGLAARLMRLANSAMYGQTKEVTNLDRATALLGLRTVKLLSLGFTLVANLNQGAIDTSIIWRRSLATSVLARRLASEIDRRLSDDAFIAGLLSNIGKLALADDEAYTATVVEHGPWLPPTQERVALGFTSDEVSAKILVSWGLPEIMGQVVADREVPPEEGRTAQLAAVLHVADAAAMLLLTEQDEDKATALDALRIGGARHLGLTLTQLEEIISDVSPELNDIAAMFDLDAIAGPPIADIVMSAQAHMAKLSLDVVSALSHEQQRNEALASDNIRLAAEASTDPLTGLPNRRTFSAYMANQIEGRLRKPRSSAIGVIMMDLDHFKSINDNFGHGTGDEVLKEIGDRIQGTTRRGELTARVGGEEFAVILPDVSGVELGLAAERFRSLIGDTPVETAIGPLSVTVSIGATYTNDPRPGAENTLLSTADAALYESKNAGRNRVTTRSME
ncbi:MAG: GGDEF domain-containing protein [Actinomycetia bacterium]|nr:GGDEF domain-containing protein [Actinomycetes bacterium]MCP5035334.1 GGDEF domain-containing protein [Actinomycetes bacterium]